MESSRQSGSSRVEPYEPLVITLSSDSEPEDEKPLTPKRCRVSAQAQGNIFIPAILRRPMRRNISAGNVGGVSTVVNQTRTSDVTNGDTNSGARIAVAGAQPENDGTPDGSDSGNKPFEPKIEGTFSLSQSGGNNEVVSFINNIRSLREDNEKLRAADTVNKEKCEKTLIELNSAKETIQKLRQEVSTSDHHVEDLQSQIDKQNLENKLQKEKITCITSSVVALQQQLHEIIQDAGLDAKRVKPSTSADATTAATTEETSQALVESGSGDTEDEEMTELMKCVERMEKFSSQIKAISETDEQLKAEIAMSNSLLQQIQNALSIGSKETDKEVATASTSRVLTRRGKHALDRGLRGTD